jgi:8-oxo-dGTP pyrophosphatase MutT (NUDIX family)
MITGPARLSVVSWEQSYLGQLRAVAGRQVLLFVGSRCVVRDAAGRVLLIRRADNHHWAWPAGAMELGESAAENAARELFEETGLTATAVTPFALYSGAAHTFTNEWGDTYQLHVTAFRVDAWEGELVRTTDETIDAAFVDPAALPSPVMPTVPAVLADLARFEATGAFVLG